MLTYEEKVAFKYNELHILSVNTPTHCIAELHMVLD